MLCRRQNGSQEAPQEENAIDSSDREEEEQKALEAAIAASLQDDRGNAWVDVPDELSLDEREEQERKALAAAMAESLRENEERKALEKPLQEWSADDLVARFTGSPILAEVSQTIK